MGELDVSPERLNIEPLFPYHAERLIDTESTI
jgi:hypothetical protein